jgi:hypothetical protein
MTQPENVLEFKNLHFQKKRFYIMHLSYGNNTKRNELWNFARQKDLVGLDHSTITNDWPIIKEEIKDDISGAWRNQFDMFCENMTNESMENGDIVVVMAGKDFVLGIGKIVGPHSYNLSYRTKEQFFDHVRPVEWLLEYDFAKRKRINRIEKFERTLFCIEPSDELWDYFMLLTFLPQLNTVISSPFQQQDGNLRALELIQTELKKETAVVNRYKRSKELVDRLKSLYNYQCQLCSSQSTNIPQIPMKNGGNYVEVHHIKGFNEVTDVGLDQDRGDYIIDNYKNTITVCVYHHKLLHRHKAEFSFDSSKKAFISKDRSILIPVVLNKHL